MPSAYYDASLNAGGRGFTLRLNVSQASQDVASNTSQVSWSLYLIKGTNSYSSGTKSWSVNIGGVTAGGSRAGYDFRNYSTLLLGSGTATIGHAADGQANIYSSGSFDDSNFPTFGSGSTGGYLTLDTIPRATQPTVSPSAGDTASTFTIGHSPATSTFVHDIAYSLDGGTSYVDIQTGIVGTDLSTGWTPAHALLPNSSSVTAIIRAITRNSVGGTIIGTKTVNLPLTVPATIKPVISSVSWEDSQVIGPDMPTLMGGAGRFVQRWSKLKPTVTASGAGGSTVASSAVTQSGQVTPSGVAFGLPVTISGAVPYSAVATDSRARDSDAYVNTVAVTAYNFPSLPTPVVTRTSDAGGATPSPTGTYLAITPLASVSSLVFGGIEKNLLEWQVRTRPAGGVWTTKQAWTAATVSGNTWTTKYVAGGGYLASAEYEVEVSIRDLFGKNGFSPTSTVVALTVPIPSEEVFMDWDGANGIGIGKYRTNGMLDVAGQIFQNNGEPVIDQGDAATNSEIATGTAVDRFVSPATLTHSNTLRSNALIGTVASDWTFGKPNVTLAVGGAVVSAFLPPNDQDIQPGSTVVLERLPGDIWYITAAVSSGPTFLRSLPLTAGPFWTPVYDAPENDKSVQFGNPTITKSSTGWVIACGIFKITTNRTYSATEVITNLPVGMRPMKQLAFFSRFYNGTGGETGATIKVATNGDVTFATAQAMSGGAYISFGNVQFNTATTTPMTLAAGWSSWGGEYGVPGYWKDPYGVVYLDGGISGSAVGTAWTPPAGYEPEPAITNYHFSTVNSGAGLSYVGVGATNRLHVQITASAHLSAVVYPVNGHTLNWQTFGNIYNSWTNYGSGHPLAQWAVRPDGLVQLRGLLYGGVIGSHARLVPEGSRWQRRIIRQTVSGAASGALYLYGDVGSIIPTQGSNAWVSLDGILIAPNH